jgi:hypothetical protein
MQAEIAQIAGQVDEIEDPRRGYALVKERISRLRDAGFQVPEDLARMERRLMVECLAESQGR